MEKHLKSSTNLKRVKNLLALLKEHGVTRYRDGEMEIVLAAEEPQWEGQTEEQAEYEIPVAQWTS